MVPLLFFVSMSVHIMVRPPGGAGQCHAQANSKGLLVTLFVSG
jgi:hypothetical protein